jgi:bifunctional ADP-heptose synthase (sugar kinase/adenylyltransferase)
LKSVDFTEIFTEDTPLNLILKVRPKILVKGGDWKIDQIVGAKEVIADGGDVFSLNFVDGYSTTSIINKINHT